MPDITMREDGEKCPWHKDCLRWMAPGGAWQSWSYYYAMFGDKCDMFTETEKS